MKNSYKIHLILLALTSALFFGQQNGAQKRNAAGKTSLIHSLSPTQKLTLLQNYKEDLMVEELEIPEDKKEEFSALYTEYQKSQKNIKGTFQKKENFENLNDEDAKKELDDSFDVGQKLLDNKKEYSKKFQRVIKPQQVLRLFENEGRLRTKVRERSRQIQETRNSTENTGSFPNSRAPVLQNKRPASSGGRR